MATLLPLLNTRGEAAAILEAIGKLPGQIGAVRIEQIPPCGSGADRAAGSARDRRDRAVRIGLDFAVQPVNRAVAGLNPSIGVIGTIHCNRNRFPPPSPRRDRIAEYPPEEPACMPGQRPSVTSARSLASRGSAQLSLRTRKRRKS